MQNKLYSWFVNRISPLKPILIAFAFSPWLIIVYFIVSSFSAQLDENDQNIIKNFIEWFGTAYSLFLALVLVNAWAKFEIVEREFDSELDAIVTLRQTVSHISSNDNSIENDSPVQDFKNNTENIIKEYIEHVTTNYQLEHLIVQQRRNGEKILERVGTEVISLAQKGLVVENLISEVFKNINDAIDIRGDRISHARQRVPRTVWLVAIVASAVWLLPFFGLQIHNSFVSSVLIVGVTFVIVIVLVIVKDLDGPFEGTWKISLEDWSEFLELLNPNPHIIFIYNIQNAVIDKVKTLVGIDVCKLNSFSRLGLFGIRWRVFLRKIQRNYSKPDRKVKCDVLYSNEVHYYGLDKNIPIDKLPLVVLKLGDKFDILINTQEINDCRDLTKFEEIFNKTIKDYIS